MKHANPVSLERPFWSPLAPHATLVAQSIWKNSFLFNVREKMK
ncbi:MAG TPA: hypothetical protein VNT99_09485 [Methylomirabilota bacterium]|nr:hypothetical protein [Methylomirabilota bacterium]